MNNRAHAFLATAVRFSIPSVPIMLAALPSRHVWLCANDHSQFPTVQPCYVQTASI
jgi:hypothetical protein